MGNTLKFGKVYLAQLQNFLASYLISHKLSNIVRNNLPRNTPAIYTPAATLCLRYSRELLPIVINLLLSAARKNY